MTLNPFRRQVVGKASHYMDNMAIAIQKKLQIINNQMNFGETERAEAMKRKETLVSRNRSPSIRRVTFKAIPETKKEID